MRRVIAAVLVVTGILTTIAGAPVALAEPAHQPPQGPAKVAFAGDFPALVDHEWNFALGGFGGTSRGAPRGHVPVIFVHGNTVDAADWYPVRDDFRAAGWTDQELWAISYNGLGGNSGTALKTMNPERDQEHMEMGWDGQVRVTNNDVNVPDLYDFITAVQSYTGSSRFVLVSHSLGVTLARKVLQVHPELRADLLAFVGIAGGNHGTSLCPPGSEGNVVSCNEIAAGTAWLADLNGAEGADETYAPAKWMTVYDGSGAGDPAYAGSPYAQSPALKGAENWQFPNTYHNDLRVDPVIVDVYLKFIQNAETLAAEQPATPSTDGDSPVVEAATGGGSASVPLPRPATSFRPPSATGVNAAAPAAATNKSATSSGKAQSGVITITAGGSAPRPQGDKAAWVLWMLGVLLVGGAGLVAYDRRRTMKPVTA